MNFDFDSVVIGSGVVGLSIARSLSFSGRKVLLLEKKKVIGQGISSRNSEVIHAGIYYPFGSLKRHLCIDGKKRLVRYCADRNVEYKLLGKLIVANSKEELETLSDIFSNGIKNGVSDLRMVSENELRSIEPELRAKQAILSPSSGIVDSHSLMLSLQGDFELKDGIMIFGSSVSRINQLVGGFSVSVEGHEDFEVTSKELINSAGLHSQELSSKIPTIEEMSIPKTRYCKGNYFSLSSKPPFSRLIYPVPNNSGLGIHYTLDLSGRAKFGPDTEWIESPDYNVDFSLKDKFYKAIQHYYPSLKIDDLKPDYAGIRPKVVDADEPAADFLIQFEDTHSLPGYVALYGIESPGLTACLAIAHYVCETLNSHNKKN